MERSYISGIIESKKEEKALIKGWVHDTRDLGKIRFLLLRDISGIIQVTAVKSEVDKKIFGLMAQNRESVISVEGKTKSSKQAPGGIEIIP